MSAVLDASALLALWLDETGADLVEAAVSEGAAISAVNLAEVLSVLIRARPDLAGELAEAANARDDARRLESLGAVGIALPGALAVEPFTLADALRTAAIFPDSRAHGLSLGDRACLMLGLRLGWPVLTADHAWGRMGTKALGVEVQSIR
ncbi:MAG: PIN domain-containing protein [Candidatus Dormibacteria bacterium]